MRLKENILGRTLAVALLALLLPACHIPSQWLEPVPQQRYSAEQHDETARFRRQFLAPEAHQPERRIAYDPRLGKIPARTVLTAQGLAIQNKEGCIACHPDKAFHGRQQLPENDEK